jgi:hypothetical protein
LIVVCGDGLCHGTASVGLEAPSCVAPYDGHFCKSCLPHYFLGDSGCTACTASNTSTTAVVMIVLLLLTALCALWLQRQSRKLSETELQAIVAIVKSLWQPARIIITYAQVSSQMGSVLNVTFPPMFLAIMKQLSFLNLADALVGSQCIGLGTFLSRWMVSVVVQPLVMATIVGVIYMYQRSRSPVEARKNMLSNGFFALFLAFPGLIRASFASWQCSANLSDTAVDFTVLLADDRESCEDFSHDVLQYLSAFFILVVGLGLPLGSVWLLRRTYAHVAEEEPATYERIARELGLKRSDVARALCRDIRVGSTFGTLVDTYKPELYYWESIDMLRKVNLVGVPLLFRASASMQAVVFAMLAVVFGLLQAQQQPYKIGIDNVLRMMTEQHIVVVAAISGALISEKKGGSWSLESRLMVYDVLLLVSFFGMVLGPLVINVVIKVARVQRLMTKSLQDAGKKMEQFAKATNMLVKLTAALTWLSWIEETDEELDWSDTGAADENEQAWAGVNVRMAYARFRVGLASARDKVTLNNYLAGPTGAGLDALPADALRELLVAHFNADAALTGEILKMHLEVVAEEDRNELVQMCWSEGLSAPSAVADPSATLNPIGGIHVAAREVDHMTERVQPALPMRPSPQLAIDGEMSIMPALQRGNESDALSPQEVFERVDRDGSGLICFDEFSQWWTQRQLATTGTLDEAALAGIQPAWQDAGVDGSGELDRDEFTSVIHLMAKSEWQEAFDAASGRPYYYHRATKETRWAQPDADMQVHAFLRQHGITRGDDCASTAGAGVGLPSLDTLRALRALPPLRALPSLENSPPPMAIAADASLEQIRDVLRAYLWKNSSMDAEERAAKVDVIDAEMDREPNFLSTLILVITSEQTSLRPL